MEMRVEQMLILQMRKAAPPKQEPPFAWSAAEVPLTKPLSIEMPTDSAPRGNLPTSLLNHETSDHLLSRL